MAELAPAASLQQPNLHTSPMMWAAPKFPREAGHPAARNSPPQSLDVNSCWAGRYSHCTTEHHAPAGRLFWPPSGVRLSCLRQPVRDKSRATPHVSLAHCFRLQFVDGQVEQSGRSDVWTRVDALCAWRRPSGVVANRCRRWQLAPDAGSSGADGLGDRGGGGGGRRPRRTKTPRVTNAAGGAGLLWCRSLPQDGAEWSGTDAWCRPCRRSGNTPASVTYQ